MSAVSNKQNVLYFMQELLWLAITVAIIWAVLQPVTSKIDYIYLKINAFFIFIFITYFRYTVTFKSLPFLKPGWIRLLLFTINLSLFIYLAHNVQKLLSLADNFYIEDFGFPHTFIGEEAKRSFFKYLYTEIVFSGTASLVTLVAFQLRLIVSYWQYYKHQADILMEE